MPLLSVEPHTVYGLRAFWHLTENAEKLQTRLFHLNIGAHALPEISHPARLREYLAMRVLLQEAAPHLQIAYRGTGQPWVVFPGGYVSLTHSSTLLGFVHHPFLRMGMDVQAPSEKLVKISGRFVHTDEWLFIPPDRADQHVLCIWCMKEAIFKCYGSNLPFRENIRVAPFSPYQNEAVHCRVLHGGRVYHHAVALEEKLGLCCATVIS